MAGGNVETSQRITDVVLGALAQALPDRIPAASQGTMNNVTIGGSRADGTPFAYYETIGGGMGAGPDGDGLIGRAGPHDQHAQHAGGGAGTGLSRSGCAATGCAAAAADRERIAAATASCASIEILAPATVTMLSERRAVAPWGLAGGGDAQPGRNLIIHADGVEEVLPSKFTRRLFPGDRLRIETPGGGGWGRV